MTPQRHRYTHSCIYIIFCLVNCMPREKGIAQVINSNFLLDDTWKFQAYLFLLICSGTLGEKENQGTMPKHVAIILDGNRRWAKQNGLTISEGQEAGCRRALDMTEEFFTAGINTVSLFAFSTENWRRPQVWFQKIWKTDHF